MSRLTGNIYTGSLYLGLISYLLNEKDPLRPVSSESDQQKRVLMFSYGSGSASSMFILNIRSPSFLGKLEESVQEQLKSRVKISPRDYDLLMARRKDNYGKFPQKLQIHFDEIRSGVYFLREIKEAGQREYMKMSDLQASPHKETSRIGSASLSRLAQMTKQFEYSIQKKQGNLALDKFYQKDLKTRQEIVSNT